MYLRVLAATDVVEHHLATANAIENRVTPAGIPDAVLVELVLRGLDAILDEGDGNLVVMEGVQSEARHCACRFLH